MFLLVVGIHQHLLLLVVPASVYAGRAFPAGSRNNPSSVSADRSFSAGWRNHAARPMTRPTSHYFQHFRSPGYYNQLYMDEGRRRTAVKTLAGCSWKIKRPYMQWGSKNNGGSHQSMWTILIRIKISELCIIHEGGLALFKCYSWTVWPSYDDKEFILPGWLRWSILEEKNLLNNGLKNGGRGL
ncbi:hypothetical protein Tco_0671871 [Tanacetum coccineum]